MDAAEFRETVLAFYAECGRSLPWRHTRDPYAILVSEVMLQQTQVPRVIPKYEAFLHAFPNVRTLADAPLADVLAAWSGLGYNRRAKSLKDAAGRVVTEYGGQVPGTLEALVTLPGIGHATAAQILAFAFDVAVPFIETNIRAVYLHHFFEDAEDVPDSAILPLVEATLDRRNPRSWYYALMDYGTHLKATMPNPGRRSAHHTRQSTFEGSMRQLRGAILRELTARPGQTAHALAPALHDDPERVALALETLRSEGFLADADGCWHIA